MVTRFKKDGVYGVVYPEALFTAPSGEIWKWSEKVRRTWLRYLRAEAPVNKRPRKNPQTARNPFGGVQRGNLKRRVGVSKRRTGPESAEITARSNAPYSMFVIEGTGPVIYAHRKMKKKSGGMRLPKGNGFRAGRVNAVSGQKPNNFMDRAIDRTWRRHRLGP